tara:strand:- start:204 stop:497 length:294 start_codon:yes stop_codon:yes gene_type:complete
MGLFLMTFTEDLDTFFNDFKVTVSYKNVNYTGILDQPDEIVADDRILTTDYELQVKTDELGSVVFNDEITVDSEKYKVRSVRKIDDGKLSIISLIKV